MDLLKTLLADATPRIVEQLVDRLDLSTEGAEALVPVVADSALGILRVRSDELDLDDLPRLADRLAQEIDAEEIGPPQRPSAPKPPNRASRRCSPSFSPPPSASRDSSEASRASRRC